MASPTKRPYYVLFVRQPGEEGYENESGSPDLDEIRARAGREIMRGAASAWITQLVDVVTRPPSARRLNTGRSGKKAVRRG